MGGFDAVDAGFVNLVTVYASIQGALCFRFGAEG